ncbi:hypothetical protein COLO4_18670 [Corchorus olitorius]|uniref:Nucleoside phosphorylase domain-containing protein n=1 Tax=Corchorus olitorius TaxID=93759 RepID=A0A1R3J8D3_9ROSI|nr:hypothetical protein COLO4_18670 [Corchorus olitorius]
MNIQKHVSFIMLILGFIAMLNEGQTDAAVSAKVQKLIHKANLDGPYVGLRYGDGPSDELGLESDGDYTREIGFLNFANYTTSVPACSSYDNLLNNIWYQPEEVFPIDGTPEQRQHIFWVPVDSNYFQISQTLENLKLESCLNSTTCLDKTPKVVNVERGTSASIFLSNVAYRTFIFNRFNISTFDMESAAVALVCFQQRVPFIIIRALSGSGGSGGPNEANVFPSLASNNAVMVVIEFINQLNQPTEAAI